MIFLLGKFVITKHAAEQYNRRVKNKSQLKRSISYDLKTLNIKKIIHIGDDIHVFTKGYKEFIFAKGAKILFLKTVIKRNRDDTDTIIEKRISQKQQLELAMA